MQKFLSDLRRRISLRLVKSATTTAERIRFPDLATDSLSKDNFTTICLILKKTHKVRTPSLYVHSKVGCIELPRKIIHISLLKPISHQQSVFVNWNMLQQISNSSTQVNKTPKHQKSPPMDWFNYINDDNLKLAIPVGPRFQADVPEWSGPPHKRYPHSALCELESAKWLGTVTWSMENSTPASEGEEGVIGKGRPDSCNCASPGSVLCCKRHVSKKTAHLQKHLGPAFQKWKFDEMGEAVAKQWKQPEQQRLTHLIRKNLLSEDKDFIKPALECFPSKSKKAIISYYFNIYVPRRMSVQTRSGCTIVDTDDEDEMSKKPCSKGSRKRTRVDGITFYSPKLVKTRYLTGRR